MFSDIISAPEQIWEQANKFWQISTAKNGMQTATAASIHLHSAYNPQREALSAVSQNSVWEKSTTIFLGFGLGYHVIEWAKMVANEKTVTKAEKSSLSPALKLIEPDPLHFFAALMILDWTEVFKIENLIIALACPTESIMSLLEDQTKINIGDSGVSDSYIFDLPAFTCHAPEYFEIVKKLIERNRTKNEINAATLRKFGKLWENNCKKNKEIVLRKSLDGSNFTFNKNVITDIDPSATFTDSIRRRANKWILVAAGPTLQNLLPRIKEMQKDYVVICVETALRTLLSAGISPDYIILMDPQYWAYRHIAGLHAPDSILITEISTYPAVFHFDCKEIFLCKSQIPNGNQIENEAGLKLVDLGAGGSVASSAWNFAKLCGAQEIQLAGLDLGYPGKQTHVKGSSAEQTFHTVSNRLQTVEKMNTSALYSIGTETSFDYNNEPIQTDARMKMFAWWFESRISACPEVKTYTMSKSSLKIPGVAD